MHRLCTWIAACCITLTAQPLWAADAGAGALRFATPPQAGLLACVDCHSDNPQLNNFGNIWSGRNAVALIQRAVSSNTGGMGYFNSFYSSADFANIAAFLGNAPASLVFPITALGDTSAAQTMTISSSTKLGIDGLAWALEGDYVQLASSCGTSVARFSSCTLDIALRPSVSGTRRGALTITHDGTPTPIRIALAGEGLSRPRAVATLTPGAWNFGASTPGLPGTVRHVVLANQSDAALTLGAISTSAADFVFAGGSCIGGAVLASGQRCVVALRFEPTALGERRGRLLIVHDGVGGSSVADLAGVAVAGTAAALAADIEAVDFGNVVPGTASATQRVNVVNRSSAPLTLRELSVSDPAFAIQASDCTAALASQQHCSVTLAFQPGRAGVFSGELRVAAAADVAPLRLPLLGRAASSLLHAVPSRLALAARLGQTRSARLTVLNRGVVAWMPAGFSVSGPEAVDFAIAADNGAQLCRSGVAVAPGASCTVLIHFTPGAAGPRVARLLLGQDAATAPLQVELSGQGEVAGAAPRGELWVDTALLAFTDRALAGAAGASEVRSVQLSNRGQGALPWGRLELVGEHAGDFSLGGSCRVTEPLAAGGACSVELNFVPRAVGLRTATLVMWPLGQDAPALVSLSGRGLGSAAAAPGASTAAAVPMSHAAAAVGNASTSAAFTFTNGGSASTAPVSWRFSGDAATEFSLDASAGCANEAVLAPGASCTLRVLFHPAQAGLRLARLSLAGGASGEGFALSGQGVAVARGELRAAPSQLTFQARTGEASAAQRLWLRNVGAASLRVDKLSLAGSGFSFTAVDGCSADGFELLPGDACTVDVAWSGDAAAAAGGRFTAAGSDTGASAVVLLSVSEDPAQLGNAGTGGGASGLVWLLALMLGTLVAGRTESRNA